MIIPRMSGSLTQPKPYGSNSSIVRSPTSLASWQVSHSPWLDSMDIPGTPTEMLPPLPRRSQLAPQNTPTERPWHGKHDLEILVVSHGFLVVSHGFPYGSLNQWTNAMIWSWCFSMRTERQPSRVIHLFQASSNPPAGCWQPIFLGWNPHEIDGRLQELISKADQLTHHA